MVTAKDHPLMPTQVALEEQMRLDTRARYFRIHETALERGDVADTHAGVNILNALYKPFLEGMKKWAKEKEEGRAGRRARALIMLQDFNDDETLAYIFMKHVINTTMTLRQKDKRVSRNRLTRVALICAGAIHDEMRMRYFRENRHALLKKIAKDFNKRDLPRRRRRELMIKQFHTQQLEWEAPGWNQRERLQLGITLLDIFERTTGAIEQMTLIEPGRVKTIQCVGFTDKMIAAVGERMEEAADMFTVFYPMVVPPKPWSNSSLVGGAYYTDNVHPYRLVKGAKVNYLREMEHRDLSKVIDPINALQGTAWRVNPVMLNVLTHVFENNMDVPGLPSADPKDLPPVPPGVDDDEEILKEYRKVRYMVHDTNRRMISKRISVLRTISMAERFANYEAIYFPYDLDSRGRAYPKVPFLNPQGPDYVKGLLEFSEGKPITADDYSAFYLTVAIANAWGQDKLPLEDRAAWVEENEGMLLSVAADPLGDLRWRDADEPFMALRGALEWAGYCEYGEGYLSHMPIHFDATCSGLQHFSALLLDEVGGYHVNLTGCDTRQDIYAAVAEKAAATLALDTCDEARVALQMGITRSLCKRPVMIVPYSGTFNACMEYVFDHYQERVEAGEVLPVELSDIMRTITPLVAKHVWAAIGNTVIAARGAMDWITGTARLVSKNNSAPIQWSTPDGFVVQQAKYEEAHLKVSTFLDGGRRIQSVIVNDRDTLDGRKMAQSLSPNFIHSLDACHMRGAIRKAEEIGGMSYAMIHDSFGVHAADMHRFVHECIKPAFVEMYDDTNLLSRFHAEICANIKEEDLKHVKPLPPKGNLNIQEVLNSQFFFS